MGFACLALQTPGKPLNLWEAAILLQCFFHSQFLIFRARHFSLCLENMEPQPGSPRSVRAPASKGRSLVASVPPTSLDVVCAPVSPQWSCKEALGRAGAWRDSWLVLDPQLGQGGAQT